LCVVLARQKSTVQTGPALRGGLAKMDVQAVKEKVASRGGEVPDVAPPWGTPWGNLFVPTPLVPERLAGTGTRHGTAALAGRRAALSDHGAAGS
jgi:hypothetical protein